MLIALLKVEYMRIRRKRLAAAAVILCLMAAGCGAKAPAADTVAAGGMEEAAAQTAGGMEETAAQTAGGTEEAAAQTAGGTEEAAGQVAAEDETNSQIDVVEEGMEPVYGDELKDGVYQVKADSSSSMFQITACELTVKDGSMSAVMTMGGTGYLKLYMGTGEEALKASEEDYIPYVENGDGAHTFKVPVEALDMGTPCSAFSRKKEKWYDRVLVFRSDSLPAAAFAEGKIATAESLKLDDGMYTVEVALGGGSGRASVESPASLRVEGGKAFATIIWGSSNYDYMKVDGQKFDAEGTEGNSTFEIPVWAFDRKLAVIADTIAMSEPHEIEYTLNFDSGTLKKAE